MPAAIFESKRAMFMAALAAQHAGEACVTRSRVVAALLRTPSISEFCTRAKIDSARVIDDIDDPQALSFAECERNLLRECALKGFRWGSREHMATVVLRPLDPVVKRVIDGILFEPPHLNIEPLKLLLRIIQVDQAMAECLAGHGLTAERVNAALEEG